LLVARHAAAVAPEAGGAPSTGTKPLQAPFAFIENAGQAKAPVRFYVKGPQGMVYFTPTEIVFDIREKQPKPHADKSKDDAGPVPPPRTRGVVLRLSFPGANANPEIASLEPLPGRLNDFRGTDPAKWHGDIRTFGKIAYRDLYPGIDLEFYGEKGTLKRRFVIHGQGDIQAVALRYAGAKKVQVAADGALELITDIGTIREEAIEVLRESVAAPFPLAYVSDTDGLVKLVLREGKKR
jgi:hypothetical protein